jgi:hypothetical protein
MFTNAEEDPILMAKGTEKHGPSLSVVVSRSKTSFSLEKPGSLAVGWVREAQCNRVPVLVEGVIFSLICCGHGHGGALLNNFRFLLEKLGGFVGRWGRGGRCNRVPVPVEIALL